MVLSERLEEFLEKPNLGILATLRKDGSPHLTVVWYEWADGEVLLTVTDTRVKYKNVMRDARVSLAVTANEHPYKEVVLEGIAEVTPEGGPELFRRLALKYDGAVEGDKYANYSNSRDKPASHEVQAHPHHALGLRQRGRRPPGLGLHT